MGAVPAVSRVVAKARRAISEEERRCVGAGLGNRLGNNGLAAAARTRENRVERPVSTAVARLVANLGAGGRKPLGVQVPPPALKSTCK